MKKNYLLSILLGLTTFFYSSTAFTQDFSNKGKEFWLAYSYHVGMSGGGNPTMTLYITSDVNTSYNVEIYGVTTLQTGNILPNQVISVVIPTAYFINIDGLLSNRAIHVTAAKPIVVYSFITRSQASAASLCLPVNVLGKEYFATSFTQISNENNSNSYITIVGVEDNTTVEITPTANTVGGWLANSTHTVNLNKGQVYQVLGTTTGTSGVDLSGTTIKSIASLGGGCKRIAVFSGSGKLSISTPGCSAGSADNLYQQLYPVASWGKKFLTVPSFGKPNNYFRVIRSNPATNLYVNGVLIPAASFTNNYYQFLNSRPNLIEADNPISVVQYFTSQGCPSGVGGNPTPYDPDMIILNPVEQNINKVTLVNSPLTVSGAHQHHLHVVMNNSGVNTTAFSSFRFDGATVPAASWITHPSETNYSYLYLSNVSQGNHTLVSDSGFNALAYGYGNAETYGYSAGANVKDLYQKIGVQTQYGIETTPSVCTGSPFKFRISLPYEPLQLDWDLHLLPGAPPNVTQTGSPFVPFDSTTFVNGKQIWWYSLPTQYSFGTVGIFPVQITALTSNTDGCGNIQDIDFELEISAPPAADFNWNPNECIADIVQFNDASTTVKPTYKFWWSFGDPASGANNISTLKNPTHLFSAPGPYTIRYANITTPGCLSDTIEKQIVIAPLPSATISGTIGVCINSPSQDITFTATGGTAPFTFSYTVDNGTGPGPVQTINTTAGNSVSIPVSAATAGTFTYTLVGVKNLNSSLCTQAITGQSATVTVTANTTINLTSATTTTSQAVCVNTPITDITYAIGGGGTAATVSGLPTGVTGVYAGGIVTISGTPANVSTTPQTFNYTVNATGACLPSSVTGTITINPDATITLTSAPATTAQELCKNTALTDITYSITGGATGITGTGFPTGVAYSLAGGVVTINGTPTVAGTFNYTLITTGTCAQKQSTGTIIVNELPTANFTVVAPNCENKPITFNDASSPNSGNLNSWNWNFGDAATGTGVTTTHTYAVAGTYTATLSVTTDKGCTSPILASQSVNVTVNPKAGFIVPEVCINDVAAVFIDTSKILPGNTITSWKWDFGDPGSGALNTATTKDGTHLYTATGSYMVTHIAFSSTGCSDTTQTPIFINGANPVTDFSVSNPATLCSNELVSITNLSTVNPGSVTKVEIYWDNVGAPAVFELDDVPAPNKVYTHKYPTLQTTQNYTIRFRAYSGILCVNDRFRTITVNAAPKVQFNPIPNICLDAAPHQITPAEASEIGGVPGIGTFSGPGITTGGLFSPAIAGPGTHTIKYTFTATAGGCIDELTKTIHVYTPPVADFTISTPVCETKDVTFKDNTLATEGALTTRTWDFGDGSPLVVKNDNAAFTHKFPAYGPYTVRLIVTTSNGCQSTPKLIPITVNPQPKVNFIIPASVCLPNANVTFNDISSIADGTEASFKYNWDFGDPASGAVNSSTGKNPSHTYTAVGPFDVRLQVESAAGCLHDTIIKLNTIHPQPLAAFTTDKIDVCIGGSFNFTDRTDPLDGTITQWNWTLDDGNVRNTPVFTYTYGAEGSYKVGLFTFNSHGCRSTTANTTVYVNPYPGANAGPDKFVLEGGQVMLTPAVPAGINVTYLWSPAATLNNATISNPLASPKDDITYTLVVTSDKGCAARPDQVFVKVLKMPAIPNIFSPNGDGIHDRWGIEHLNTYPGATIDVYNRYGQLVFHSVGYNTQWDGKANGKDVPVGTYYYVIDPKNGRKKIAGYVDVIR